MVNTSYKSHELKMGKKQNGGWPMVIVGVSQL